jgi:hypothetical protein
MSKDIDAQTMGQLAAGAAAQHELVENPSPEILLLGHVRIERNAEGRRRAEQLRAFADRALDVLKAAGLMLLIGLMVAGAGSSAGAQERPVYEPRVAAERSLGQLSKTQLLALHKDLRGITHTPVMVEIYCTGNFCRDLAEDLDEAFESAGFDASLQTPIFDPGKGQGISPDTPQTRAMADAIRKATDGRVVLQVFDPLDGNGKKVGLTDRVQILLARRKPQ